MSSARLQVAKAEPLVSKGIVNQYELDEARLNLKSKEAMLTQIRTSLANANVNSGYTTIKSPIDGVIGGIPYKTGSLVSSASPQPLTTVSDIRKLYAYFSLNEKQLLDFVSKTKGGAMHEKIKNFSPVSLVLADGTVYPEKGLLQAVGGLINPATGSATLRAGFGNPKALIRSGSSGKIRIKKNVDNAVVVPQSATYELQDRKFVYVVDKVGVVKGRQIFVQPIAFDQSYVIDSGLVAGERIVAQGMGNLKDGVKIIPTDPAKMSAAPAGY